MEIKEINNKQSWENFFSQSNIGEKSFLQSWNWGEFQKALGEKIWRVGVYGNNELIAIAMAVKVSAKRARFLFVPHGPVIRNKDLGIEGKILEKLVEKFKEVAKQEKCSFIRIAALWGRKEENKKIFKNLGFRTAPIHINPELTWELDIMPTEEKLLSGMRKTTRYLIKQGINNKEIQIEKSQNVKDVEIFNEIYKRTANRHNFTPFSPNYLKKEFLSFLPDNQVLLISAKYNNEYLSSAMIVFWQGIAFYHQGASTQDRPRIPASYLVQWEAIKEAKRRNCQIYNFWGIADVIDISKHQNHPWYGLSLFKMGFGGFRKEYLKTQDLVLSFSYWLSFLIEKIRKIKRRL